VLVTDAEWRGIRIAAVRHDTSVQGYVTSTVLRRLQNEDRESLEAADRAGKSG
jgi:hypothetical protein